jgi:sortase B
MKIKKYCLKWKMLLIPLLLFFIILLLISIYNIVKWRLDNNTVNKLIDDIYNQIDINEITDNEKTEIINQDDKISKSSPYWNYLKINLIDVNFKDLKLLNDDIVGWLKLEGTNINYPFVQSNDNEYYLNHSIDKSYNSAGWVFLDYRNNIKNLDKNTIIYAHGRLDGIMFNSLKNIIKNNWYENNNNNNIIRISTEYQNTLWEVFSIYNIDTTNNYIQVSFKNNHEFEIFANQLMKRSIYKFNTSINQNDKIITLSTCYNKKQKMVMHAKLIKFENK